MNLDRDTQLFLSVSQSPGSVGMSIYNRLFQEMGINAVYISRYLETAHGFGGIIRALQVRGASVSMPFKSAVITELDELSPEAKQTQSVNTILNNGGRLTGHNTDYWGFSKLLQRLGSQPEKVVIYGTGSVVSSLVLACRDAGVQHLVLAGRSLEKVRARATELQVTPTGPLPALDDSVLLVNATPAKFEDLQNWPRAQLNGATIFDIKVSQDFGPNANAVKKSGGQFLPGLAMFLYQFQKQFELYTQRCLDDQKLRSLAKELFQYDLA